MPTPEAKAPKREQAAPEQPAKSTTQKETKEDLEAVTKQAAQKETASSEKEQIKAAKEKIETITGREIETFTSEGGGMFVVEDSEGNTVRYDVNAGDITAVDYTTTKGETHEYNVLGPSDDEEQKGLTLERDNLKFTISSDAALGRIEKIKGEGAMEVGDEDIVDEISVGEYDKDAKRPPEPPTESPETRMDTEEKPKKKGFFARLFGR